MRDGRIVEERSRDCPARASDRFCAPVRSAVLAGGFGLGVAVMAALLGVAEVVLEQSQSPALVGGGTLSSRAPPAG